MSGYFPNSNMRDLMFGLTSVPAYNPAAYNPSTFLTRLVQPYNNNYPINNMMSMYGTQPIRTINDPQVALNFYNPNTGNVHSRVELGNQNTNLLSSLIGTNTATTTTANIGSSIKTKKNFNKGDITATIEGPQTKVDAIVNMLNIIL